MNEQDVQNQINSLRKQIRHHDHLYYVLNQPKISDQKYDGLFKSLRDLEQKYPELITEDSPTQRVSEQPVEGFEHIRHSVPMLSIDNTYNAEELRAFDKRVQKQLESEEYSYVVELKIDGLAINLRYEAGKLIRAATRGNGEVGDDVTANVRTIKAVPLSLLDEGKVPDVIEVRGEVYLPGKSFLALNKERQEKGENLFANPRNAAAGSLKLLDARTTASRNLSFFAYSIGEVSEELSDSHFKILESFKDFGLPVNPNIKEAKNIDDVIDICLGWSAKKDELDYEIDGMVIKVDSLSQRQKLGSTGRAPRWCISYKFPAERAETIVKSIDVQVGKSGILTPVVNLEPVQLAGTVVKRASLHNFDMMEKLDVREGDTVLIEKAGEIIPQVVTVKKENRPKGAARFSVPKKCPICGSDAVKDEAGVYIRCSNKKCVGQLKEQVKYFAGRGQMDIDKLGEALIEQLIDKGLINDVADLYSLQKDQLAELERMGDKSAQNVIEAIEAGKNRPLWRLIAGLGITHIGAQSAQLLTDHFSSIEALSNAKAEDLEAIDQIGPKMAESVYEYFRNPRNQNIIEKLLKAGVNPKEKRSEKKSQILAGKTIVVTGSLEKFTREEIKQAIVDNGGKVSSSVSKKTDFVLVGKDTGSKLEKANQLGVKTVSEDEFLKMLGGKA